MDPGSLVSYDLPVLSAPALPHGSSGAVPERRNAESPIGGSAVIGPSGVTVEDGVAEEARIGAIDCGSVVRSLRVGAKLVNTQLV
jgi:hypothetical protein